MCIYFFLVIKDASSWRWWDDIAGVHLFISWCSFSLLTCLLILTLVNDSSRPCLPQYIPWTYLSWLYFFFKFWPVIGDEDLILLLRHYELENYLLEWKLEYFSLLSLCLCLQLSCAGCSVSIRSWLGLNSRMATRERLGGCAVWQIISGKICSLYSQFFILTVNFRPWHFQHFSRIFWTRNYLFGMAHSRIQRCSGKGYAIMGHVIR